MEEAYEGLPPSRKAASAQGSTFYFTGKPCKHGHIAERRTITGTCRTCHRLSTQRRNQTKKRRAYMKRYCRANLHVYAVYNSKRRAAKLNATPEWADQDAIARKYETARIAQELSGEPCHVDHIVPLQSEEVCGLHVAENLRVVHASDNLSKGNQHVFTELEVVAAPNID